MQTELKDAPARNSRRDAQRRVLSLTALALGATLLFRLGGLGTPVAMADMAIKGDGYAAITTLSDNQEYLWLIDDRSESLLIYRAVGGIGGRGSVEMVERQQLPEMFRQARLGATGGRP